MNARVQVPTGARFGGLVAVQEVPPDPTDKHKRRQWHFRCDCGVEKVLRLSHVRAGAIASCGCGMHPSRHGHAPLSNWSRTYHTWKCMRQRCSNPGATGYKYYGGRGIKVCDRWQSFDSFLADMGERPQGKTLDRWPNVDGDYEPSNCRWATPTEQANNKRPLKSRKQA